MEKHGLNPRTKKRKRKSWTERRKIKNRQSKIGIEAKIQQGKQTRGLLIRRAGNAGDSDVSIYF
jgi:hypothetical protein